MNQTTALDMYAVGQRVKYYRTLAGMTQAQLAEEIGVSTKHMSKIEMGYYNTVFATYYLIAQVLDIPIDALVKNQLNSTSIGFRYLLENDTSDFSKKQMELLSDFIQILKKHNNI